MKCSKVLALLTPLVLLTSALPALAQTNIGAIKAGSITSNFVSANAGIVNTQSISTLTLTKANGSYVPTREYIADPVKAPFKFNALGSEWQQNLPAGTKSSLALRTSFTGTDWSDWVTVENIDTAITLKDPSNMAGELVTGEGNYYQYKVTLLTTNAKVTPTLKNVKITYINSEQPATQTLEPQTVSTLPDLKIYSRAEWGADPSLLNWDPEYWTSDNTITSNASSATVNKIVVHHTAGTNNIPDPKASVRAVYYYHSVTRGWGDVGYNYLIDPYGNVYEGRAGGNGVIGAHVYGYNYGSVGVSMMGTFSDVLPTAKAQAALSKIMAYKSAQNNPKNTLLTVYGHRDLGQTQCPGNAFYPVLKSTTTGSIIDNAKKALLDLAESRYSLTSFLALSPSTIREGETLTATYTVKNTTDASITISSLGAYAYRGTNTNDRTIFPASTNITLDPNQEYTYTGQTTVTKPGSWTVLAIGKTKNLYTKLAAATTDIATTQTFTASAIDYTKLQLTTDIQTTPDNAPANENIELTATIQNNNSYPVTLKNIAALCTVGTTSANFPSVPNVTIAAGQSYSLTTLRKFTTAGTYTTEISVQKPTGVWVDLKNLSGSAVTKQFTILSTASFDTRVSVPLTLPTKIYSGQAAAASFALKNYSQTTTQFDEVTIKVTRNEMDYSFTSALNVSLPAAGTYTFNGSRSFIEAGAYTAYIAGKQGSTWQNLSGATIFNVEPALPADLKLSSSISITPNLRLGYTATTTFKIKNYGGTSATVQALEATLRSTTSNQDFATVSAITIPAGGEYTYSKSRALTATGNFTLTATYKMADVWKTIPAATTSIINKKSLTVGTVDYSKVKATTSLYIPSGIRTGRTITATITIKNTASYAIPLKTLVVAGRLGTKISDWQAKTITLAAGQTYRFTTTKVFKEKGWYTSWASIQGYNGSWYRIYGTTTSIVTKKTYYVNN